MSPNIHEERLRFLQREIEALNCLIDDALFEADELTLDLCTHKRNRLQNELKILLKECKELK